MELKGPRFHLTGLKPWMHSPQITSLAHFQSTQRDDVVNIEIQSKSPEEFWVFHLTFQFGHTSWNADESWIPHESLGPRWTPQYTLDLYPDGEATLALDADAFLPHWSARQIVQLYSSKIHFGEFEEYRQQYKPQGCRSTREQPLLQFERPWSSDKNPAIRQTLEIFRCRSPTSVVPTLLNVVLSHQTERWSFPQGRMTVSSVGEGKRLVIPKGCEGIIDLIINHFGSDVPVPGDPTNPNTPRTSNGDLTSHTFTDTVLGTHDDCFAAKALIDLRNGRD